MQSKFCYFILANPQMQSITETCHASYNKTVTELGPEAFWFTDSLQAEGLYANDKYVSTINIFIGEYS